MEHAPLLEFMLERHAIYLRRAAGSPPPWTQDPILQAYSFTNVYRELDRTTIWLARNWRTPHAQDPDLWFALTVARHVNLPATLARLPYPVPWFPNDFIQALAHTPSPVFGSAYMIKPSRIPGLSTPEYLAHKVFSPMWERRARLRPAPGRTLAQQHALFTGCYSIGSFMSAQVIADLKHAPTLRRAPDWFTWCAPGPGSQKGLNLLLGLPINKLWSQADFLLAANALQAQINQEWPCAPLDAQDVQNTLCEFSKYRSAQMGLKQPKRKYRGPA